MANSLNGKRVAIFATDGFEQVELTEPKKNLENAGATVTLLSIDEVVVDGQFITSRKPDDIPAFSREMINALR